MERQSSGTETSKAVTISNHVWKLKRYGRFIPKTKSKASGRGSAWKIFESCEKSGQLELNILGSGHLLVSQGQEVLEGFSLLNAQSFLKIQHKTDSLLFNITVKGENRLIRLQFDGSSRAEAASFCCKAVEMLQIYVPVQEHMITPSSAATPASAALTNPAEPGTSEQQQKASEDAPQAAIAMGSLSIEHLSQHFLGERELSLPMAYHQSTLPPGDLEALLRLCLLDSGFPAFVEEVENKLKELIQD